MAIIEGYLDHGLGACNSMPHFIENGKLQCYKNWPPLGFMTFALWMKIFGNTLLSARALMVFISALSIFPVCLTQEISAQSKIFGLGINPTLWTSAIHLAVFIFGLHRRLYSTVLGIGNIALHQKEYQRTYCIMLYWIFHSLDGYFSFARLCLCQTVQEKHPYWHSELLYPDPRRYWFDSQSNRIIHGPNQSSL